MIAAVVQTSTNTVVNMIVAPASDPAPAGCLLVDVTTIPCGIGWTYSPSTGTFNDPNPPPATNTVLL